MNTLLKRFYALDKDPEPLESLLNVSAEWKPGDFDRAEYWAGLRPMTPTGAPIFGRSRHENLWFNTGLGHMGWTMSHGAARITADLVAGKASPIPLDGMMVS